MYFSLSRLEQIGAIVSRQITLYEAIQRFDLDNAARRLTASTRKQYVNSLRMFQTWCEGEGISLLTDVTTTVIRRYLVDLASRINAHGDPLSAEYVHGLARAVRRLFAFAVEDELITETPFKRIKMPRLPERVLIDLSPAEVEAVLRACKYRRDKAIVSLMVDTGIRANELCALNVEDADLDDGAILVRKGKGQKERWLFAGKRARTALRLYMLERGLARPSAPLFASQKGARRLITNSIVQLFRRLQRTSGVHHATAHALRRTFAIACLRSGMDIHSLRLLMGHSDEWMLRKYLNLTKGDLRTAHERHSPLDNM